MNSRSGCCLHTIKRVEIQYFRSIYNVVIKEFSDFNMLSGKNDVGKSNVLKALNLFFNNRIDTKTEFVFSENFNLLRLQQVRRNSIKGRQFIRIKVTFERGNSFEKTLPTFFSVTKKWYRNDFYPSDVKNDIKNRMESEGMTFNERRSKTSLTMFLNKIRFFYIPAIKDNKIFEEMLLCLRETIYNEKLANDQNLESVLNDTANKVAKAANDLSDEFYDVTKIKSEIIPPNRVADLYNTLRIITVTDNGSVSILDRGDGIRVRYIPSILNYIAKNTRNICIWGYEEPENSLEYNLALKMAEDFIHYSHDSQIIVTTHSPAFIGLENKNVKFFRCYKNQESTSVLDMKEVEQREELEEGLGYIKLLKEQNYFYKKKVRELEVEKNISESLKKILESDSKPILMTEGKTDVDILKTAWKRLYREKCPFVIKSCNTYSEQAEVSAAGCRMLANTLKSWKYDASNLLIGLFDNDEEGVKEFNNLGANFESYNDNIKKHQNGNVYAMILPVTEQLKKFAQYKNLCIEFYFDYECLNTKVDGMGLELEPQPITENWGAVEKSKRMPSIEKGELHFFKPKTNTKAYFAERIVPTLNEDKFSNFKVLFEQLLEIIQREGIQSEFLSECAVSLDNEGREKDGGIK